MNIKRTDQTNSTVSAKSYALPELCIYAGLLFALLMIFFFLNYYTPLSLKDDLNYSFSLATNQRLTSLEDIFRSLSVHYQTQNGRLLVHFIDQFFLLTGKNVFNIANTIALLLLSCLICFHGTGELSFKSLPLLLVVISMFYIYTPEFAEDFLWVSGASNYLYSAIIILIYLIPYRYALTHPSGKKSAAAEIILLLLMLVLGFAAGETMENASAAMIAVIVCFLLIYRIRDIRYRLWMFSPGPLFGLFVLLMAPGERNRMGHSASVSIPGMIKNAMTTSLAFAVHFYAFILIIAYFVYRYASHFSGENKRSLKEHLYSWDVPLAYFIGFLSAAYSLIVVEGGIGVLSRVWFCPMVFCIIMILNSYKLVYPCLPELSERVKCVFVSLIAVISIAVSTCGLVNVVGRYDEFLRREALIREQVSADSGKIVIPSISSSSRFSIYYLDGDALEYGTGKNQATARYYGTDAAFRDDTIALVRSAD